MTDRIRDPDTVVDELCTHLKSNGWSWSRQRAGLSWCGKLLGTDRKKKVKLVVRIGVKGRGRKSRRGKWPNGELSIQLYRMEMTDGIVWGPGDMRSVASDIIRGFTRNGRTTKAEFNFVEGIPQSQADDILDWIDTHARAWVEAGEGVAAQVEWLHEESLKSPRERSLVA